MKNFTVTVERKSSAFRTMQVFATCRAEARAKALAAAKGMGMDLSTSVTEDKVVGCSTEGRARGNR